MTPRPVWRTIVLAIGLVTPVAACGLPAVSPPSSQTTGPSMTDGTTGSAPAASAAIDPGEGRLIWLVDAGGTAGIWTTDLVGGDVRTYVSGVAEEGGSIHDAVLVADAVVFIRDGIAASDLWIVRPGAGPVRLLSGVASFLVVDPGELVVARDVGTHRELVRVPLDGRRTTQLGELPAQGPPGDVVDGPFGLAVSPDGRTVAAGWAGGPVEVLGSVRGSYHDTGAPLVVDDDGRLIATTGRAGEAYLVRDDRLVDLAPPDSDPLVAAGTVIVAWGSVSEDGSLRTVEVRDLRSGAARAYPASGSATNVRGLTARQVLLEATAFDPLQRIVGFLDLDDGRFGTFEASAPAIGA